MKRYFFIPLLVLTFFLVTIPSPVIAQTVSPPDDGATGVVFGKIVNQNQGIPVTGSLDVMLHIWDQQYVDMGMEHGNSGM